MDDDRSKPEIEREWSYENKTSLDSKDFLKQVSDHLKGAKVVSFGEIHDENHEQDFDWLLPHQEEIVTALEKYSQIQDIVSPEPVDTLRKLLGHESPLMLELERQKPSFNTLRESHSSRLFALAILPLARVNGFTDIVLEGLEPSNFRHIIKDKRSKDLIGDLLKCLLAMLTGLRIHGIPVSGGILSTGENVGDDLFRKTAEITDEFQDAKVLVYGGAAHNLTDPGDLSISGPFGPIKLAKLSYAPRAIAKWGGRYISIDLFSRKTLERTKKIGDTIYGQMMDDSVKGEITAFTHKSGQITYIIG